MNSPRKEKLTTINSPNIKLGVHQQSHWFNVSDVQGIRMIDHPVCLRCLESGSTINVLTDVNYDSKTILIP